MKRPVDGNSIVPLIKYMAYKGAFNAGGYKEVVSSGNFLIKEEKKKQLIFSNLEPQNWNQHWDTQGINSSLVSIAKAAGYKDEGVFTSYSARRGFVTDYFKQNCLKDGKFTVEQWEILRIYIGWDKDSTAQERYISEELKNLLSISGVAEGESTKSKEIMIHRLQKMDHQDLLATDEDREKEEMRKTEEKIEDSDYLSSQLRQIILNWCEQEKQVAFSFRDLELKFYRFQGFTFPEGATTFRKSRREIIAHWRRCAQKRFVEEGETPKYPNEEDLKKWKSGKKRRTGGENIGKLDSKKRVDLSEKLAEAIKRHDPEKTREWEISQADGQTRKNMWLALKRRYLVAQGFPLCGSSVPSSIPSWVKMAEERLRNG
eukprot:TRINITY_DN5013_c0_g1_i1.p1 TRINITY_DN5013_c0_g1~~TRINITY_DN5013_c0_g1_i1.p1  ORF type:complete len:398 (-),score=121.98 TRINITY_DN5013_c0_g1_i1:125-1243(-)